jgi:hypothetical protein
MTGRMRITAALLAVAGLLYVALGGSTTQSKLAEAQPVESYCRGYKVCIEKQTTTVSNVEFPFIVEIEEVAHDSVPSQVNGAIINGSGTYYLADGEKLGIEFCGEARVTEVPVPGWQLIDIDCEGTLDFGYEIRGNSVEIYYLIGDEGSYLHCMFVNREVKQPLNLGGLFAGQPTPLPTAPSAVAPAATAPVITPPRTGEAGIK